MVKTKDKVELFLGQYRKVIRESLGVPEKAVVISIYPVSYPDNRTGGDMSGNMLTEGILNGVFPPTRIIDESVWLNLSTRLPYEGNEIRKWFSVSEEGFDTRKGLANAISDAVREHYSSISVNLPLLRREI